MLTRIKQWLEPPRFEGDDDQTNQTRIANTLIIYLGAGLLIVIFILIPLFAFQKIGSWIIAIIILCGLVIGRRLIFQGRLQLGGMLIFAILYLCILSMLILSGGSSNTAMFYFATVVLIAGYFLDAHVVNGFTVATFLTAMGISFLQERGLVEIPKVFVFNSVFSWLATGLGLLFMIRTRDLFVGNLHNALTLARQENENRQQVESHFRVIAEVQDILLRPCERKDIYRLVSEKVKELIGDSITATSILDEKRRTVRMGYYYGVDIPFEKVLSVIGFDPRQKDFSLDAMAEEDLNIYRNRNLEILEGGLYALITRLAPKPACMLIEKLLRVQKIYTMGFVHKNEHMGGLVIMARSDITPHIAAIEQIVNLATIAIERKRAEEEVENSGKRFQSLIAHGRDEISLLSADGTLFWESPSVISTLGYAPNQFMGENIFALIHPDDQAWTSAMYAQVVQSPGRIQEGEFRLMHADGAWRWIECTATNLLDEPSVQAIVLNYHDITERKQAEANYRTIFENATVGIFQSTPDGHFRNINPAMARIFGYASPQEMLISIADINTQIYVDPSSRQEFQRQLAEQGEVNEFIGENYQKDGRIIWTLTNARAVKDERGQILYYEGFIKDITERKHAEALLRESEQNLRAIFETMSEGIALNEIIYDENGEMVDYRILNVNKAFYSTADYRGIDVLGNLATKLYGMSPEFIKEFWKQHKEKNSTAYAEMRSPISNRFFYITTSPFVNDRFVTSFFDITERKQMEDILRESETRLKFSQQVAHVGHWTWDIITNQVTWSDEMKRIFGLDPDTFDGDMNKIIAEVIHPDDREKVDRSNVSVLTEQKPVPLEYRVIWRDGSVHTVWAEAGEKTLDANGKIIKLSGIIQDITERKRAEEKFAKAFQASPTIITISRLSDGRLIDVNESFEQIMGYTREEALGHTVFELGIWVNLTEREHLLPIFLTNGKLRNEEVHFRTKRGEAITCLYSAELIELNGEKCALAVIEDITTRKQAEEKISAALEEKEALLREVHHRVKNNMQVIIILIRMRTRLTQDAGTIQFLTELENQALTMSLVYEQLYQSENLARVGMAQYLRQLTSNVLDSYGRRSAIQLHLDAALSLDVAQATPCGLIVNELFSNILKYAFPPDFKETRSVSITLRQDDKTYHLTVSDNGVGFPPGYDWREGKSMGLRLVNLWATHQLGGTLTVSEKTGTTFAITFELKD